MKYFHEMAGKYLFVIIISTVLKCAVLQTSGNEIENDASISDELIKLSLNATAKLPETVTTSIPNTLIPKVPESLIPEVPESLNETAARLAISNEQALLKQAIADSFDSLIPESESSTLEPAPSESTLEEHIHQNVLHLPETCSERKLHRIQPVQDELSMIRKCCPIGESFSNENFTERPEDCVESDHPFAMQPIAITLYQNCIEDNETIVDLDINVGNLCNRSVYYSESLDDRMFIIQNGSLLIMDSNGSIGFNIFTDYCVDVNEKTGKFDAIVCVSPPVEVHIGTGQTIVYTTLMLVSIPCLFFVTFIHFAIDKLNHLHGLCIGSMSFCLGVGFLLHSISQFSTLAEFRLQYVVQYFILAYYMWIFVLCLNLVLFLWIYVIRYMNFRRRHTTVHFFVYFIFAMILPIFLVVYTKIKRIPGMPSYFQQAWSESIKSGQRYFIPPVSIILAVCFVLLVIAFFGFRKLDEVLTAREDVSYHLVVNGNVQPDSLLPKIDRAFAEQVQLNARCLALLYILVVLTWILEVVTFYAPGAGEYLGFLEAMNALQGVFILIIFVIIRKKRKVIASWWHDRGSHKISEGTELQDMKRKLNSTKSEDVEQRA